MDTLGWEDEFSLMNETRTRLGLPLISPEWPIAELWSKPARVLALVAREFDVPTDKFAGRASKPSIYRVCQESRSRK